ncbi:hypothetical protein RRG08_019631 [Elysia crispata]|uniref:Uncharacterized protein n=1 Tax=Elysia crispata TaxID=231223 RepID=A0AAE0ZSZ8_9GAST|nr:hypothetical protein RRG08_019631 [Elysia crispata]
MWVYFTLAWLIKEESLREPDDDICTPSLTIVELRSGPKVRPKLGHEGRHENPKVRPLETPPVIFVGGTTPLMPDRTACQTRERRYTFPLPSDLGLKVMVKPKVKGYEHIGVRVIAAYGSIKESKTSAIIVRVAGSSIDQSFTSGSSSLMEDLYKILTPLLEVTVRSLISMAERALRTDLFQSGVLPILGDCGKCKKRPKPLALTPLVLIHHYIEAQHPFISPASEHNLLTLALLTSASEVSYCGLRQSFSRCGFGYSNTKWIFARACTCLSNRGFHRLLTRLTARPD